MLATIENEILQIVQEDQLATLLRKVESLPVLDGDSLIRRFAADAPAVYFVMGDFPVADGAAVLKGALVAVARNAAGHKEAKQGDGKVIGLYQIMDRLMSLFCSASTTSASWKVTGGDFMQNEAMFKGGIYVGVVRIESTVAVTLDPPIDLASLDDFKTFVGDFDIPPHEATTEYGKWLQTPADHSTSKPDLTDVVQVQP